MSEVVYTVKKSKFTIDGTEYDVSTVALSLATNSIPRYTIGIAAEPSKSQAQQTYVHTLSLEDLSNTYRKLQDLAMELKECDLELELEMEGEIPGVKTESKLELKQWLLKDVGMSRITTTDAFALTCVVFHPAYKLDIEAGAISKTTGVVNLNVDKYMNFKDPIEASEKAVEACIDANKMQPIQKILGSDAIDLNTPIKDFKEARDTIANRLDALKGYLKDYIKWDSHTFTQFSKDLPGESVLTTVYDGMKLALLTAWTESMFNMSYWAALQSVIAPEFAIEVIPTYEEKHLLATPAFPWRDTEEARIRMVDDLVYSVLLPGQDTNPVFGYMAAVDHMTPAAGLITVWAQAGEKTATVPAQVAFIPKTTAESTGKIRRIRVPDWLNSGRERGSRIKYTLNTLETPENYKKEFEQPIDKSSGDNKQLKDWQKGAFMHLANTFILEYKASVVAELQCPFVTKIDGKTLIPGKRIKFETWDKEHKNRIALFYGTIDSIRHIVVCSTSQAETQIALSHCTFIGGADAKVLASSPGSPVKAPYYVAEGKIDWEPKRPAPDVRG